MRESYSPKLSVRNFKFGVELELGIPYEDVEDDILLYDGWIVHDEHCGSEIVSPILEGYNGLLILRRQLKEIWDGYTSINFYDAGLHVHVDIQHLTLKHAKRLLTIGSIFDEAIFAIMDGSRYHNRYTQHCNYNLDKIKKCLTIADLQRLQKNDRYHGINFYAFTKHGTVEFRYAMATADWARVYSLTSLYLRMVSFSASELEIPLSYNDVKIDSWTSSGLNFSKKRLEQLHFLKEGFFDMLQIGGGVRSVLDEMFNKNALEMNRINDCNEEDFWEMAKPARGLKEKRKTKVK